MFERKRRQLVLASTAAAVGTMLSAGARAQRNAAFSESGAGKEVTGTKRADRPADTLLFDGRTGATSTYFNWGALLPWQNKGGDWTDAAGVDQGGSAFQTLTSRASGPFAADITNLVRHWYGHGNTGALLRSSGAGTVGLRVHADVAAQPALLLTDKSGAVQRIACSASSVLDVSTAYAGKGDSASLGSGRNLALQFALPSPEPAFVRAELQLTSLRSFSERLVARVFALRAPKVFAGGAPVAGIAAKYRSDGGIDKHPGVYFTGFADFPEGTFAADRTAAKDPLFPDAVHAAYVPGTTTASSRNHRWSTKRNGQPTRNPHNQLLVREERPNASYLTDANSECPEELYFRYYLKLRRGYHCTVEGKKLPGLAGRYGTWTGNDRFGYYNPTAGNGGNPTKGTYNGKELSGWSMRHHAYAAPSDDNPLRALIPLNYYAYFVGMGNGFGQLWRWGNHKLGFVGMEEERWYCIEHYVKVNSLTGTADSLGNMTPAPDGIVRGWVDGVMVFDRTNVALRRHPAIRVDEVWLDHYHGGTKPAESIHPFSMAGLVVAREYIGPMNR